MVRLALQGIERFEALSIEIERKEMSYTIDTIRVLPPAKYHLLLSQESALHLQSWKDFKELIRLAPPLIGCRNGEFCTQDEREISLFQSDFFREGMTWTKNMDISSTDIRHRIKKKLYCGHLVPAKTLDYIDRNQVYFC